METQPSRKPKNSPLTQQRLAAWQPILSPPWVIAGFIVVFLVFTALGVTILVESLKIVEIEVDYTDSCVQERQNATFGHPYCKGYGDFYVTQDMSPPIYLYYKLDNFYQNHRRYASSRSDTQLGGRYTPYRTIKSECNPITAFNVSSYKTDSDVPDSVVYNPCGLIAWSMFNDTFKLYKDTGELLCDGSNPDGVKCTKKGIAWKSDRDVKFKKPIGSSPNMNSSLTYYHEGNHYLPSVDDEDFIVWMRTAALPTFRKLHRIINTPLVKGKYKMEIDQNFPVKEFKGKKYFVLSTASWIGGKNMFLAITYLVVAGICLILAFVFVIGWIITWARSKVAQH